MTVETRLRPSSPDSRHALATRKQGIEESIDNYLQALKQLAKECNFRNVDAETNKNDNIRYAFISGIQSNKIRQRLLENLDMSLDDAYNQALSLEIAEISSQQFNISVNAIQNNKSKKNNILVRPESSQYDSTKSYSNESFNKRKCFFCGDRIHIRNNCPAIDATCQMSKIGNHQYDGLNLLIVKNLCADLIIGHDILEEHSFLEFSFGGPKEPIIVCNVAEASVPAVPLFANMSSDCKPIAIKSRRFSEDDKQFITQEIRKLLGEGIIEESTSPWRAQNKIMQPLKKKLMP
ncbi:uncharacterized protein LOC124541487 [Vanessa cardui]|uniref:uncharacterized protein LOC124541487 n=1 Tax=Vanessa cardui TaxID=171605 RepID=UPI001F1443B0|nr:uncharacterized protein LOC124541487 [Vanessa cardui]